MIGHFIDQISKDTFQSHHCLWHWIFDYKHPKVKYSTLVRIVYPSLFM